MFQKKITSSKNKNKLSRLSKNKLSHPSKNKNKLSRQWEFQLPQRATSVSMGLKEGLQSLSL